MKEQMTYVAIDADNVGESVGQAVLSDDAGQLSKLSEAINTGVQIFSKWAEFNGGTVISSGSDEAVFQVPITSIKDLENLKMQYTQKTGFTVSIGIGEKVSSAMKALIYAKMNGKDQITDYSPEMEEAMQQTISGNHQEAVPEQEEEMEGDSTQESAEVGQEEEKDEGGGTFLPESEKDSELAEKVATAAGEDEEQAMNEMAASNNPADEDIDLDGQPDVNEEHGEIIPDQHDIDGDGDVEHEEAMAQGDPEEYDDTGDQDDEDLDEESSELSDSIESEMGDEDMATENEAPEEMMEEDQIPEHEQELSPEDKALHDSTESMGDEEEIQQEELAAQAEEELQSEDTGEEIPMEEGAEGGDPTEDLKTVIFESLQSFKQNREYLEMIAQENPELYDSLIYTLQAMIEMARELGYGNMEEGLEDDYLGDGDEVMGEAIMDEGDVVEGEMEEDINPEDYAVDEEGGEPEESDEEDEEESEEAPGENPFAKAENFVTLLRKANAFSAKMQMIKKEQMSMKEMRERVKKKLNEQSASSVKLKSSSKNKNNPNKQKGKDKAKSNDGSFCAKSHKKMRASGKDCRANADKSSPLCSARKKFNCRGKNEEGVKKSEKLSGFLKKKVKKKN